MTRLIFTTIKIIKNSKKNIESFHFISIDNSNEKSSSIIYFHSFHVDLFLVKGKLNFIRRHWIEILMKFLRCDEYDDNHDSTDAVQWLKIDRYLGEIFDSFTIWKQCNYLWVSESSFQKILWPKKQTPPPSENKNIWFRTRIMTNCSLLFINYFNISNFR